MRLAGLMLVVLSPASLVFAQPQTPRLGIASGRVERPLTEIRTQCPQFSGIAANALRDCAVSSFGELGTVDGLSYYYATYCLMPVSAGDRCDTLPADKAAYSQRGVMIFEGRAAGDRAAVLLERVSADIGLFRYDRDIPKIVTSTDRVLLYLPIALDGTGNGNASEYYLRRDGQWERIDSESWLADLQRQLPSWLDLWKGVWPDVQTLKADAALYRPDDHDCCPTGGTVHIQLGIRDRRFVVESMTTDLSAR